MANESGRRAGMLCHSSRETLLWMLSAYHEGLDGSQEIKHTKCGHRRENPNSAFHTRRVHTQYTSLWRPHVQLAVNPSYSNPSHPHGHSNPYIINVLGHASAYLHSSCVHAVCRTVNLPLRCASPKALNTYFVPFQSERSGLLKESRTRPVAYIPLLQISLDFFFLRCFDFYNTICSTFLQNPFEEICAGIPAVSALGIKSNLRYTAQHPNTMFSYTVSV